MNPEQNKENENHTQRSTTGKLQNKKERYLRQPLKKERLPSCVIIRMTDEVSEVILLKCLMC